MVLNLNEHLKKICMSGQICGVFGAVNDDNERKDPGTVANDAGAAGGVGSNGGSATASAVWAFIGTSSSGCACLEARRRRRL